MAQAYMGARVMFCGHAGYFVADIWHVGNVNIVHASSPVTGDTVIREDVELATHQLVAFPVAGFWKPLKGLFVVPEEQVKVIKRPRAKPSRH